MGTLGEEEAIVMVEMAAEVVMEEVTVDTRVLTLVTEVEEAMVVVN